MNGWWDRASQEQKLAQIDGAIECGVGAVFVARNCGVERPNTIAAYASKYGRKFGGSAEATAKALGVRWSSARARTAYFQGDVADLWGAKTEQPYSDPAADEAFE